MGEFLSVPNKTKESEDGESNKVKTKKLKKKHKRILKIKNNSNILPKKQIRYAACGMQGWRKRMEDSHISDMNLLNGNVHVFGVFDGHGGKKQK